MKKEWDPTQYTDKYAFVFEYGSDLLGLLQPQPGERILDIGCGAGQLTAQIHQSGAAVVGIDSSPQMIAQAQSTFPGIVFFVMDAAGFSFDQPFDALFSNAALHWVLNKEEAAACMYKALRTGGRLVAELGGKGNIHIILTQLKQTLKDYGLHNHAEKNVWYFPSVGEYASVLEKQGFRVTLAQHFDRPTPLADAAHGIEDWLEMFATNYFEGVSGALKSRIKTEVQQKIKEQAFIDGVWYADYKRLRIVAIKE